MVCWLGNVLGTPPFDLIFFRFAPESRGFFRQLNCKNCLGCKVLEHFDIEIYFPPQRRAIFDLASDQMAPHRFSEPNFRPA
jgi:hypothetical protein